MIKPMKSFDEILHRPFIESLLLAFYFADKSELENEVIFLI